MYSGFYFYKSKELFLKNKYAFAKAYTPDIIAFSGKGIIFDITTVIFQLKKKHEFFQKNILKREKRNPR